MDTAIDVDGNIEGLHMSCADFCHLHIQSNRLGKECRYYNFNDLIQ